MFDKEEYRAKLWEQIENEVLANGQPDMDYSELLEMVLDSDNVEWVYDENCEPYMVKDILADVIDCWDLA